ncbi:hypothetical protein GQ53DRAFT_741014 [Thozetella sp. PMI_491]|nr:hypothetical protein GQ53DRAFT_741014 [Thozetella sp. PMI_491]
MATSRNGTPTIPPNASQSERAESIRSEKPSSIPVATRAANVTANSPRSGPPPANRPKSTLYRFLTPTEWARIAHGVGAIREGETHSVVHPTCWYWPPSGIPDGLYRDVVLERTKNLYWYHVLSTIRWFLMIVQIVIGAVLTALGSLHSNDSIPIMILAAINTIDAGLLALMHNSGLPDRYRMNKVEFSRVQDFLKEILDTGIVESGQTVDQVLAECFERFQEAKTTVLHNMPDYYAATPARVKVTKPALSAPDTDTRGHPLQLPL